MLQTESMDTSWERGFKHIRCYSLTHTPEIYLTIAEQKYKQIKANQEEIQEMKFEKMKWTSNSWKNQFQNEFLIH